MLTLAIVVSIIFVIILIINVFKEERHFKSINRGYREMNREVNKTLKDK